eukprot:EG_transcript_26081
MLSPVWIFVSSVITCLVDIGVAAPTLTITPDTLAPRAQPSAWNVTLSDIISTNLDLTFTATLPVFVAHPAFTSNVPVGCAYYHYSSSTAQSLTLYPLTYCGRGTFSFTVPDNYLAPNPSGSANVSLTGFSSPLSTIINYTGTVTSSTTPSRSPSPTATPSHTPTGTTTRTMTPTVSLIDPTITLRGTVAITQPTTYAVPVVVAPGTVVSFQQPVTFARPLTVEAGSTLDVQAAVTVAAPSVVND